MVSKDCSMDLLTLDDSPGVVAGVFPGVDEPCIVDDDDDWVDSVLRLLLLAHRGSDSAPESPDNLKSKSLKRVHDVT